MNNIPQQRVKPNMLQILWDEPYQPPEFLFHGTTQDWIAEIMARGLHRMARQFVHLSSDLDWVARFVASKPQGVAQPFIGAGLGKPGGGGIK